MRGDGRARGRFALLAGLVLFGGVGASGPARGEVVDEEAAAPPHHVYVELLGKLGLYGLGYERALRPRLHVGGAGSAYRAGSQWTLAASAYVGTSAPIRGRHRWFAQAGPELVHVREPMVVGFPGLAETRVGAQLSAGYEYRAARLLVRGHAVVTAGRGGVAPWLGSSLGVRF